MSSHNIISFFLLAEFVAFISKFIFNVSLIKLKVIKELCISLNREPPNTPTMPNIYFIHESCINLFRVWIIDDNYNR